MKTELRVHEGLKGSGVVCSLTYGDYRLIFDFGSPFRPNLEVFDGTVKERKKNALLDTLRLKKTPPLDGVYPKAALTLYDGSLYNGIQAYEDSTLKSALLISHLHLDHMSNICYLADDIPVYMHKNGKKLLEVLEDINEGTPHKNVVGVEYGETFEHGPFKITTYFNDHPCHGSTSYYIECPDVKYFYTGDIRFHGLSRERAFETIEQIAKEREIDVLIFDGVSYSPSKFKHDHSKIKELSMPSKDMIEGTFLEQKIYDDIKLRIKDRSELALFNIYHRDMQLINALDTLGRTVVYEVETAYVINKVLDRSVNFYIPDQVINPAILDYVKAHNTELSIEEINQNKSNYFVQVSYKNSMSIFSFDAKDAPFFHLFGDPFGERGCKNLQNILALNEAEYIGFSNVYSFNHAFPNQLSWLIGKLAPKNIVCVHSNNPESVNTMGANQVFPIQNEPYIYHEGLLVAK